jgi:hypothetical protein
MIDLPEKYVLKQSLIILKKVFKEWVRVERRQSGLFKNPNGHTVRIGKTSESDIGGWILKGPYIAKPIAIEVKRSDFRPNKVYGADKKRFLNQCEYLRSITDQGGVAFWVNDPGMIYSILAPVLIYGAKVDLDLNNTVFVTHTRTIKVNRPSSRN